MAKIKLITTLDMKRILRISLRFFLSFGLCFLASTSFAIDINIAEIDEVDFGTMPTDDATCSIDRNGGISGNVGCASTGIVGLFQITGDAKAKVTVTFTPGPAVNGITFTPEVGNTGSLRLDNSGNLDLQVIGDITLLSASDGAALLDYTLHVNYQ